MSNRLAQVGTFVAALGLSTVAFSVISGENICQAPTDEMLVEQAISEMVGLHSGGVSIPQEEGETIGLRLAPFSTKEAYLEANPDCCRMFTNEATAEYINPEQVVQTNYLGSVRVVTTFKVAQNTDPIRYPYDTYSVTRVFHFDKCGNTINLR